MSDDGQAAATSTNADVMGEVMQESLLTEEAAARQNSIGDASMLAQADENVPNIGNGENIAQQSSVSQETPSQAPSETPSLKPAAVDAKASPMKASPESTVAETSGAAQAKQDLNDKLSNAAPGSDQQQVPGAAHKPAQDATPAVAIENGTAHADSSAQANGHVDSPSPQTQNSNAQQSAAANGSADNQSVSVKNLIQRRSSSSADNQTDSSKERAAPARRKTEDELPEGIRALKNRFSGATSNGPSPSPQANFTPNNTIHEVPLSTIHLEVEHKPGSRFWPYKELKDLRIENGIDPTCKEDYLTDDDFSQVFKKWDLNRTQFKAQPVWRQRMQKQSVGLF